MGGCEGNSRQLRFYTGFDEYSRFTAFLDFLLDGDSPRQEEGLERRSHSALTPDNQVFLVLVRLRLGLLLQDLAFRFHISESTASRYWLGWTECMERKLKQIPVACSQRYVEAFKPQRGRFHHTQRCPLSSSPGLYAAAVRSPGEDKEQRRCPLGPKEPLLRPWLRCGCPQRLHDLWVGSRRGAGVPAPVPAGGPCAAVGPAGRNQKAGAELPQLDGQSPRLPLPA
ncbi:uncharacterized protein LOC125445174 isoform X1 [Sphaerodactylus townsendi]|uniref:uncharacterized protein LOC125445174 isoform X1 n=1 Tax=Sphaerodactylus townsendi TaxID=933632 RepID=UPI002026DBAC|nr:uncharacterized protein LOC125445174 isoform X1 [Sphaerodactylus townsendi]